MDENEKILLERFEITVESKIVYVYKQHRYDNAKDAINFASLEEERAQNHLLASKP